MSTRLLLVLVTNVNTFSGTIRNVAPEGIIISGMVGRKYEIYFECEQDISRVSAAGELDILFNTRNIFHIS